MKPQHSTAKWNVKQKNEAAKSKLKQQKANWSSKQDTQLLLHTFLFKQALHNYYCTLFSSNRLYTTTIAYLSLQKAWKGSPTVATLSAQFATSRTDRITWSNKRKLQLEVLLISAPYSPQKFIIATQAFIFRHPWDGTVRNCNWNSF